jgi:hypothetical protein
MLLDPCNAKLAPTAYRGQDGFVQRFTLNTTLSYSSNVFIYAYYPSYNGIFLAFPAASSTSVTPSWATPGPGQAFLLANAEAQRPVAGCALVDYFGTELNRSGELACGVLKASVFDSAVTADQLVALLQHKMRMPENTLEVKHLPAPADEVYWAPSSAAPDSTADRNVIVVVGTNITPTVQVGIRTTLVAEWQPKQGLGIGATSPNTADSPAGLERVRSILSRYQNWWLGAEHAANKTTQIANSAYNTAHTAYGLYRAGKTAFTAGARAVPLLMA